MVARIASLGAGTVYRLLALLLIERTIASNFGPSSYGDYKYAFTIVGIAVAIGGLGFPTSIVHMLAARRRDRRGVSGLVVLTSSLVAAVSFVAIVFLNARPLQEALGVRDASLFFWMSPAIAVLALNLLLVGVLSARNKVLSNVLINDFLQPTSLLLMLLATQGRATIHDVATYLVASLLFALVANTVVVTKAIAFERGGVGEARREVASQHMPYIVPAYLGAVLVVLSLSIDKLILGRLMESDQIGLYFSAFSLASLLNLVLAVPLFIYFPLASSYYARRKWRLFEMLHAVAGKWAVLFAMPPCWMLYWHSESILSGFFGPEFAEAGDVLALLSLSFYVSICFGYTGQSLLAMGDSRNQLRIRLCSVALTAVLAYYLGTSAGIRGVAVAMLISSILTNGAQALVVRQTGMRVYRSAYLFTLAWVAALLVFRHAARGWVAEVGTAQGVLLDCTLVLSLVVCGAVGFKSDMRLFRVFGGHRW